MLADTVRDRYNAQQTANAYLAQHHPELAAATMSALRLPTGWLIQPTVARDFSGFEC
jgi:hypothetical protein